MANTQANVSTGKPAITGAIYRAPLGTSLPTDATSTLNSAFKCLGYVSEDGLTNSNTASTEQIKAWGGDIVAQPQTEKPDTFAATFIEAMNEDVLKTTYGDSNVSGALSTGLTVRANSKELPVSAYVCDMILGTNYKRIVIARGQVTEVGDIEYKDDSVIGYPLTITAFPGGWSDTTDTDTHKEYIKAASASA